MLIICVVLPTLCQGQRYILFSLFVCESKVSLVFYLACSQVTREDPGNYREVKCFCAVAISGISYIGKLSFSNFDLFLGFGGSLTP